MCVFVGVCVCVLVCVNKYIYIYILDMFILPYITLLNFIIYFVICYILLLCYITSFLFYKKSRLFTTKHNKSFFNSYFLMTSL